MPFFKTIAMGSGILAGLCVAGIPLWIMGVPGVEGQYARGWKLGFSILMLYPLAWLANFLAFWVAKTRVSGATRLQWEEGHDAINAVLVVVALGTLAHSFRVMSSKG